MKQIAKGMLAAIMAMSLVACGSKKETADTQYKIAIDAKFAPFSMEVNGKYVGIDVELFEAIAKEENIKYELKPMDFSGIIPGLVSGQLDGGLGAMSVTEARKKQVDFSDAYYNSGLAVVANKKDTTIKSLNDLKGKKAAVKKGTVGSQFAEANASKYGFKYDYYEDSPSMMTAVSNGNADIMFEDNPVISYLVKSGQQKSLRVAVPFVGERPDYAFAVKKGKNPELLKKYNDGLKKIKANGTYKKIMDKYVG